MKTPSKPDMMGFRVKANADWIDRCTQLYMEDNVRNGQFAREIREATGKSLRAVAAAMGVSAPFLSDLELGRRVWNQGHITKWKGAIES